MSAAPLPPPCLRCGYALWDAGACRVCAVAARQHPARRALPAWARRLLAKHTAAAIEARATQTTPRQ